MYFIPDSVRRRVQTPAFVACSVVAVLFMLKLHLFEWAPACRYGAALCGKMLCSVSGNWQIVWEVPVNGIGYYIQWPIPFVFDAYSTYTSRQAGRCAGRELPVSAWCPGCGCPGPTVSPAPHNSHPPAGWQRGTR